MKQRGLIMSYVVPLSWMALGLLKKLLFHMLSLLLGALIAIPFLMLFFWLQDTYNIRF